MYKSLFVFFFLLVGTIASSAQSYFEGEVSYNLKYSNVSGELKEVMDMFPTSLHLKIKGSQSRSEQEIPNVGKKITVEDSQLQTAFILVEALDQRLATQVPPQVMQESNGSTSPGIQKMKGETIEILGYECEKVKVFADEGQEIEVYYTKSIPSAAYADFSYLNGFPLKYTLKDRDFTLEVMATSINEKELDDQLFRLGEGYNVISYEEYIGLQMPGY